MTRFAIALFLAACASAPPPPPTVDIQISGQIIDRQFRELVVRATNNGSAPLPGVRLEIAIPEGLEVIRENHSPGATLRAAKVTDSSRIYTYALPPLAPGASAAAHFPFRTQMLSALHGRIVKVVARARGGAVTTERTF